MLSNHDVVRHPTRLGLPGRDAAADRPRAPDDPVPDAGLGLRRARAATLLMLALPGSAYLYQGEELGLPEVIELPDEARQDPLDPLRRRRAGPRRVPGAAAVGRRRAVVRLRARAGVLAAAAAGWAEFALDRQRGVAGSTFELYRSALSLRSQLGLGAGSVEWVDLGPDVVAFRNGSTLVVANLGADAVALPPGCAVVLSSSSATDGVPPDTTVWATAS